LLIYIYRYKYIYIYIYIYIYVHSVDWTVVDLILMFLLLCVCVLSAQVMGKVKTVFTEEAELTNSRAAMVAMGVWATTAYIF